MWKLALFSLLLAPWAYADDALNPLADPNIPDSLKEEAAPAVSNNQGPDKNINYSSILSQAEVDDLPPEVQPPAIGTRGYRPNLLAFTAGDRTPGFGFLAEYSWNRIGLAWTASYRNQPGLAKQTFTSIQASYRWLPFSVSPYFSLGVEYGMNTKNSFGGVLGAGLEIQLYRSWFITTGYSYHQTITHGMAGGALGWAF